MFASEGYLARRREPVLTMEDLVEHDSVVAEVSDTNYLWPKDDNGNYLPFGRLTFKSNNLEAHQNAVIAGYGIGILPLAFVRPDMGLKRVMPHDTHLEALWIVAHEDLTKSVRIRSVFDFLVDALKKDRELFYGNAPSVFDRYFDYQCGEINDGSPDHEHVLVSRTLEPVRP